jgi:hypothetical protein
MDNLPEVPPGYGWDGGTRSGVYMLRAPTCCVVYPNSVLGKALSIWRCSSTGGKFEVIADVCSHEEAHAILAARAWCGLPVGGEHL